MALPRVALFRSAFFCKNTFCKVPSTNVATFGYFSYCSRNPQLIIQASKFRLLPYCVELQRSSSSRYLSSSSDLSNKPWYIRWAIKSNNAFANLLGKISPQFKKQYLQIGEGFVLFYKDSKYTYQLNRRIKSDNMKLSDLNWKDIYIKNQMSKDFARVLPTVFLMCLPVVFYIMLPVLFLYPRPFLSDHFLTSEQLEVENSKFHKHRLTLHSSVINQLVKKVKKLPESEQTEEFMAGIERLNNNLPLDSRQLLGTRELYDVVLRLEALPRIHLVTLCQIYSLRDFLLPTFMLRNKLNKMLRYTSAMDTALLRENIQGLSQQELEKLCFARGLYSNNVDRAVLASWLSDWIQLSTNLTDKEQSLLAHAAILLVKNQSSRAA